ncbi:MAG: GGDEF domain-containing protein [Planctomycetota bacterium]
MTLQILEELLPTRFTVGLNVPREAASSSAPGCLVRIYPNEGLGQLFRLQNGRINVGRDPSSDLCIEEDSVSRRHAYIEHAVGVDTVFDLESTNGTWINDLRILTKRLEPGDRLRFGSQIFTYLSATSLEAQYHESVFKIMTTDGLTRTYNRRYLLESLDRELQRCRRRSLKLSAMLIDIDHFKRVNDTWGHLAGDTILVEFAQRVSSVLQGDETFARYGGEEFALVIPDADLEEAIETAENIRLAVSTTPVLFDGERIPITVSIGVAQFSNDSAIDAASLLNFADRMLYVAKSCGRNQVQFFRKTPDHEAGQFPDVLSHHFPDAARIVTSGERL